MRSLPFFRILRRAGARAATLRFAPDDVRGVILTGYGAIATAVMGSRSAPLIISPSPQTPMMSSLRQWPEGPRPLARGGDHMPAEPQVLFRDRQPEAAGGAKQEKMPRQRRPRARHMPIAAGAPADDSRLVRVAGALWRLPAAVLGSME